MSYLEQPPPSLCLGQDIEETRQLMKQMCDPSLPTKFERPFCFVTKEGKESDAKILEQHQTILSVAPRHEEENFVKVNHHRIIDEMQKAKEGQEVITIDTRLQEVEAESAHLKPSTTMTTSVIILTRRRSGSTTFLRKQNVYVPSPSLLTVFPQKEV